MKNLITNVMFFVFMWGLGGTLVSAGVWSIGHQSSSAFETGLLLIIMGLAMAYTPIHLVVTRFPRHK